MIRIYSDKRKGIVKTIEWSEKQLNDYIFSHWVSLFPYMTFIRSEFQLRGEVRGKNQTGRVDILAFNPSTSKFVVIELKKNQDKNIRLQAADYRDYVKKNFERIYLRAIQEYNVQLPLVKEIEQTRVETILIAKEFSNRDKDYANEVDNNITLIRYEWYNYNGDTLFLMDYFNNEPLTDLQPIQKKVTKEDTAKYGKGKDADAVKILGGGELVKNISGTKFYKLSKGEIVAIKYSKQYSDKSYWYAVTPTILNKYKKEKISHMVFILHEEGVVKLPILVLKDYLKKAANTTLKKDGTIDHYHIFIKGNPEQKLYTSKKRKMWDIKEYYIQY